MNFQAALEKLRQLEAQHLNTVLTLGGQANLTFTTNQNTFSIINTANNIYEIREEHWQIILNRYNQVPHDLKFNSGQYQSHIWREKNPSTVFSPYVIAVLRHIIERAKVNFTYRYMGIGEMEIEQRRNKALELSIKASVQRNPTYSNDININVKRQVITYWKDKLVNLSEKYVNNITFDVYLDDVNTLKEEMNLEFNDAFNHPNYINNNGFRIAHSQKSLSVYLKHLWCLGLIQEPPMCPIDNIILTKTGLVYPNNKWGHINNVEEFIDKKNHIVNYAQQFGLSVCVWELLEF